MHGIKNSDNMTTIKIKFNKHFKSEVLNKLRTQIVDDKKLKLYASFKQTFKFEPYLDFLQDFNIRSPHIESGRFGNLIYQETKDFVLTAE